MDCQEEGIKATYVGESGRNAFLRGLEHTRGARNRDPKNPMVRHSEDQHNMVDSIPTFKMEILRTFSKPLQRQISEAVAIEGGAGGADFMLNSKVEWGGAKIPRITVEVGAKVKLLEYQGGAQGARGVTYPTPRQMGPPPPTQPVTREPPHGAGPTTAAPSQPTNISRAGQILTVTEARGRGRKRSQTVGETLEATTHDGTHPDAVPEIARPATKRRKVDLSRGRSSHLQPSILHYLRVTPDDKHPDARGGE